MNQIARIALQADVGGFVRNFSQAESAAGKFGATLSGLTNLGMSVASAIDAAAQKAVQGARRMAAFGVGTTLAFAGMGLAAAKFETNMKNVQTILDTGISGHALTNLNKQILEMSTQFPQTANQIAEGLYNIVSSGFSSAADATKVLTAATMAASAGLTTVEASGMAITSVLNAYGLSADHAMDVSDALFQTVNLGVVTFEELTGTIGDVVGTASAASVGFDEMGSAIATMTLSGISANEAGTSLNRLIQSIIDPSEELSSAFRTMGYESGATALKQDGLREVIEKLRIASNGNIESLLRWFPEIRAARGALALMSAEGTNYARVAAGIENAQGRAGATMRAFNIQAQSTSAAWQRFQNTLQAAAISIGQYFLAPAKVLIDVLGTLVGVVDNLPAPLRAVIGYGGLLTSVFMALGGIFLAFRLRTLVANIALQQLGNGLQFLGTRAGAAGAQWTALGTRISGIQGPFGITRALFAGVTSVIGRMGTGIAGAGVHVQALGARMGRAGGIVNTFGGWMTKASEAGNLFSRGMGAAGRGLLNLLRLAGPMALLGIGIVSAFTQGKSAAEGFADSLTKSLKPENPDSIVKTLDKVQAKIREIQEGFAEGKGPGGFFQQLLKNVGDLATNIVGIDVIKDSTWDEMLKLDNLKKSEREILQTGRNLQENLTAVFSELFPAATAGKNIERVAKLRGPLEDLQRRLVELRREAKENALQPLLHQETEGKIRSVKERIQELKGEMKGKWVLPLDDAHLRRFALVAERAGIDVTGAFKKSEPARERLIAELRDMAGFFSNVGLTGGQVTEQMVANYQRMEKASKDAAKGAQEAFTKSFDLLQNVDPAKVFPGTEALIPMGLQIEQFYKDAFEKATRFYDGIEDLQRRGLNPTVISKFLQAGPEAAGAVVQAAVEDSTGGLIAVLNQGEHMLAQFAQRAAETARITQRAIMAPTDALTRQLPDALRVMNEMFSQGNLATVESVASALSMDEESVQQIATNFGMSLSRHVPTKMPDFGTATQPTVNRLRDLYNALDQFTKLPAGAIQTISENMNKVLRLPEGPKKEVALQNMLNVLKGFRDSGFLTDAQYVYSVDIIMDEIKKQQFEEFLRNWRVQGPGLGQPLLTTEQRNFLISVIGQEDALQKIIEFGTFVKLTPTQLDTLLRAVGTPEAIAEADRLKQFFASFVPNTGPAANERGTDLTAEDNASGKVETARSNLKRTFGEEGNPKNWWARLTGDKTDIDNKTDDARRKIKEVADEKPGKPWWTKFMGDTTHLGDAISRAKIDISSLDTDVTVKLSGVWSGIRGDGPGRGAAGNVYARIQPFLGSGLSISSGYRNRARNNAVGGSPTSYHMDAANPALDIVGSTAALDRLYGQLAAMGGWRELLWRVPGHYDHLHVAKRGMVTRGPQFALIGEAGTEAVLPLTRFGDMKKIISQSGAAASIMRAAAQAAGVPHMQTGAVVGAPVVDPNLAIGAAYVTALRTQEFFDMLGRTASGINTVNQAVAESGGDFWEGLSRSEHELRSMAQALFDVEVAAGTAAAMQLANSGLIGQAFDQAARSVMDQARALKQYTEDRAREQASGGAGGFGGGGATSPQQTAANEAAEALKRFKESVISSARSLASLSSPMDIRTLVSGKATAQMMQFAGGIDFLKTAGLNATTLKDLIEQGPEAATTVRRIVGGGPELITQINKQVAAIESIAKALTGKLGKDLSTLAEPKITDAAVVQQTFEFYGVPNTGSAAQEFAWALKTTSI